MNTTEKTQLISQMQQLLQQSFHLEDIHITDDSDQHIGHAGAKDGKGHFSIYLVSPDFNNVKKIQRHRMIYSCLDNLMKTDIHALKIQAIAANEI